MQAMLLQQPQPIENNPLQLVELPDPEPASHEIRIRIHSCGICHTDLHTIEAELPLPKLPLIPGHEIVGVVDRIGSNVTRFHPGDRVGIPWLNWTCGECQFCRRGQENLCENARFTGYHVDGGYAQYTIISENFAYPIPEQFSDSHAAPLLCAGIIGFRALRLSNIRPGERLGFYGFGASAHLAIQVAIHWGCQVYVFSRSEEHRQHARQLGATWVGIATENPPEKIHSAIIFAPAGWLIPEALRVLEKGGTLALAGIYMDSIPEMDYNLIYHERIIRSVANSTRQDAEEFLRLAAEIPISTQIESFPLREANRALQLMKHSKIRGAGVLEIPV
ncbi:alcohol dehydrogenase [candidate division KSB1 bacterium]|nr:MAG: alcohol dehydrogenase [candidate division KSB1 bacterium]RKY89551.1 MAG: alcohol dehydrogenase [candidate division KSB1 bacterium]HDI51771.1 zinc-binding alcohol dehydrogenase family protein [Bacteroidota bacterium]